MKIAILSMQRVVNFGSVLQAYSLREIIKEICGETAEFLDIDERNALDVTRTICEEADYYQTAEYVNTLFQRYKRWTISKLSFYNKKLIKKFMRDELGLTSKNINDQYDFVVVGSDEVFNHSKGINLQRHGEIQQAKNIISYAASCGSARYEDINQEHIAIVKSAMSNFDSISVRDTATKQYVEHLYAGRIAHHLDPVLVGDLYKRNHDPVRIKKYLLVYAYGHRIRTKEEINAIKDFAKSKGLKTVAVGGSQFWCDLYIPVSPFRLLDYFYYADYVVTDTFHGCIFSIINGKRFATIVRKSNTAKVTGLLQDLELTDRIVDDMQNLANVISKEIDYREVEDILQQQRIETRNYLKNALGV